MPDVSHEFLCEIVDEGEDAACNDVAFDLGEPDFDLIEPGRIGRSVVNLNLGMRSKELLNASGFMCGKIVGDDVDFTPARLVRDDLGKKRDKFLAGVTRGGFAMWSLIIC